MSIRQFIEFKKALKAFSYEANVKSINNFQKSLKGLLQHLGSQKETPVTIVFDGWCSGKNGLKLDLAQLLKANPGYKVKVKRHLRRDLIRHRKSFGLFPGYKVHFTQDLKIRPERIEPPTFFAIRNSNEFYRPLKSNASSHYREKSIEKSLGKLLMKTSSSDFFYLDRVHPVTSASPGFRVNPRSLILNNLHEVVELLRFLDDPSCSTSILNLIKSDYGEGTYHDRVSFLIHGNNFSPSPGSRVLSIDRRLSSFPTISDQPFVEADRERNTVKFRKKIASLGVPSGKFKVIKKAIVFQGSQVEKSGKLILIEDAADPTQEFVSGQWQYLWSGPAQSCHVLCTESSNETISIQAGALLGGRNDLNWYHWLAEYAPRATLDKEIPRNVPFLVSDRVPEYYLEVIKDLSDREILRLPRDQKWAVAELYVSQPILQILDSTSIPFDKGLSANFELLSSFRKKLKSVEQGGELPKKVFLKRNSGHRGLKNQNRLEKIAVGLGLSSIDPAELSWRDQSSLFRNAEIVVGASGAVMANYLLLPENARVLALASRNTWNFLEPAYLCLVSGAKFMYLLGRPEKIKSSSLNKMHASFRVNPNEFRKKVKSLLTSQDKK